MVEKKRDVICHSFFSGLKPRDHVIGQSFIQPLYIFFLSVDVIFIIIISSSSHHKNGAQEKKNSTG